MSAMGDRFICIWTHRMSAQQLAEHVIKGVPSTHIEELKDLVSNCFHNLTCPKIETIPSLINLSELVALTRTYVKYDKSYRNADRIGDTETPTRLLQAFHSVAFASAAIDGSPTIRPQDTQLAERVAWDTIPRRIYHTIRILRHKPLSLTEFQDKMHLIRDSFENLCSRLVAMNLIKTDLINGTECVQLSQSIMDLLV
jgi:hypothetical protein